MEPGSVLRLSRTERVREGAGETPKQGGHINSDEREMA